MVCASSCSWSITARTIGGSRWRGRGSRRSRSNWWSARSTRSRASTTSCGRPSWRTRAATSARNGCRTTWPCRCRCSSDSTSSVALCCCTRSYSRTPRPAALGPWIVLTSTPGSYWRPWWPSARGPCCLSSWSRCGSSLPGRYGSARGKKDGR